MDFVVGEEPKRLDYPMETVWEINNEMQFLVAQTLYKRYILKNLGPHDEF